MGSILRLPGTREVPQSTPKTVKSTMDTVIITPEAVEKWKLPPFQRPFKHNKKVEALVEELKAEGGIIPGVITLGVMSGERYLIDGQHRIEAFKMTGLSEGLANIRICHFDSMADMGEEFVKLNSSLVRLKTDDILRGLEPSHSGLRKVRKQCPFVGYGYVGANAANAPTVSMSGVLRMWSGSAPETPTPGVAATHDLANNLTDDEADRLCDFLINCFEAWGRDPENKRLWQAINLGMCAWVWRRTVSAASSGRTVKFTKERFRQGLMALSANSKYVDWLVGRKMGDRDRSPCYARIRAIFTNRMQQEGMNKLSWPRPTWFTYGGAHEKSII